MDNSNSVYFPKIRYQKSTSCTSYSLTYYVMTYQYNKYYNTSASLEENVMSPKWTFNLAYMGGSTNSGKLNSTFNILKQNGVANIEDVPVDFEGSFRPSSYTLDYHARDDIWEKAQQNKVKDFYKITVGNSDYDTVVYGPNDENLTLIKSALAKGEILSFSTDESSFRYCKIKSNPEVPYNDDFVGESIVPRCDYGSGGAHQMTIVGYDDNIWYDINEDGIVQEGEKGAFKVANSWGTSYENSGFVWISYDAINKVSSVNNDNINNKDRLKLFDNGNQVIGLTIEDRSENEEFYLELKLKSSKRNTVKVQVSDLNEVDNLVILEPLNGEDGGEYSFDGTTENNEGQFIFDLSEYNEALTKEKILNDGVKITISDTKEDDVSLEVMDVTLVDRKNNTKTSLINEVKSLNNSSIEVFSKEVVVDAPTNLDYSINNENKVTLSWTPSKTSDVSYQIFRNDILIMETDKTSFVDDFNSNGIVKYSIRAVNSDRFKSEKIDIKVNNSYCKIYYKNDNYSNAYIHYKIGDNLWTVSPGIKMEQSVEKEGYFEYVINLNNYSESETVTVCFNNGNGSWDNNGNNNYSFSKGSFIVENGNITNYNEPLKINGINYNKKSPLKIGEVINMYPQILGGSGEYRVSYYIYYEDTLDEEYGQSEFNWCPDKFGVYRIDCYVTDKITKERVKTSEEYEILSKDDFEITEIIFDKQSPQLKNTTIGLEIKTSIDEQFDDLSYKVLCSDSENRIKSINLSAKDKNDNKNKFVWNYSPNSGVYYLDVTVTNNVTGVVKNKRFEYIISDGQIQVESVKIYNGNVSYGKEVDTVKASNYYEARVKAIGGTGKYSKYTYGYYFNGEYHEFDNSTSNRLKINLETPGDYIIVCSATDSDGNIATSTCNLKVTQGDFYFESITKEPSSNIRLNDIVTLKFNFKYISGDVKYRIIENNEVIQEFTTGNTFKYTAKEAGYHTLTVEAKDSRDIVESLRVTLYVDNSELDINSYGIDKSGENLILSMKASGGQGEYNYKMTVIKSGKVLFTRDFDTNNTAIWKPEEEGSCIVYFKVKDGTGTEVVKSMIYNVELDDLIVESPTNLNWKINENNKVELSWNPSATNDVKYEIFRNDTLIKETTETSIIDELEILGEYNYSVRAVNSNGIASEKISVPVKNIFCKVYYKNDNYTNAFIHYRIGSNDWTVVPGIQIKQSTDMDGYYEYIVDLNEYSDNETINVCFNNGSGNWDNNGNKNYTLSSGYYTVENGIVTQIEKPEIYFKINQVNITPNSSIKIGDIVSIETSVVNAIGDVKYSIEYINKTTGNNGVICSNATTNTASWIPNEVGDYLLTIIAVDNNETVKKEINLTVNEISQNKTVIYYKGYDTPYIHYQINNQAWTSVPGVAMIATSEMEGYTHKYEINLGDESGVTVCFNNGQGSWDSNNGSNYKFESGTYTYSAGKIIKIQ